MFFKKKQEKENNLTPKEEWEQKIDLLRLDSIKAWKFKYKKEIDYELREFYRSKWIDDNPYIDKNDGLRITFENKLLWEIIINRCSRPGFGNNSDFELDWDYFEINNRDSKAELAIKRYFNLITEEENRKEQEIKEDRRRIKQKEEDEIYLKKLQEIQWIKPLDKDLQKSINSSKRLIEIADSIVKLTKEAEKIRKKYYNIN